MIYLGIYASLSRYQNQWWDSLLMHIWITRLGWANCKVNHQKTHSIPILKAPVHIITTVLFRSLWLMSDTPRVIEWNIWPIGLSTAVLHKINIANLEWYNFCYMKCNDSQRYRVIISLCKQGAVSIRKTVLPGMVIPMLKIRRPNGRLIFNMEIAIRR